MADTGRGVAGAMTANGVIAAGREENGKHLPLQAPHHVLWMINITGLPLRRVTVRAVGLRTGLGSHTRLRGRGWRGIQCIMSDDRCTGRRMSPRGQREGWCLCRGCSGSPRRSLRLCSLKRAPVNGVTPAAAEVFGSAQGHACHEGEGDDRHLHAGVCGGWRVRGVSVRPCLEMITTWEEQ